jgi:hypothetical protein
MHFDRLTARNKIYADQVSMSVEFALTELIQKFPILLSSNLKITAALLINDSMFSVPGYFSYFPRLDIFFVYLVKVKANFVQA